MQENTPAPITSVAPSQLAQFHRFLKRTLGKSGVDLDLSVRQIAVMTTLRLQAAAGDSVRHIAEYLKVSKPVVTRALDRLVEAGFATRVQNPKDRRLVQAALTPAGESFLDEITTA